MSKAKSLEKLKKAIEEGDVSMAEEAAKEALEAGVPPYEAIIDGLSKGMDTISKGFENGEIFLTQMVLAADAMTAATKILEAKIPKDELARGRMGTVVIGTPQGDIHEIGKNIVSTLLRGSGFDVVDIGRDVPIEEFADKAKELNANIVAASTLMTTTTPLQAAIIKALKEAGIRDKVKTLHGGATVTAEYIRSIGGDGYAENAAEAVRVAKKLVGKG